MHIFAGKPVFPAVRFVTPRCLAVLRVLGLRSTIDARTLLEAAKEVETWGLSMPAQQPARQSVILQSAGELAAHFCRNTQMLQDATLLEEIRDIAFVPAIRGIPGGAGTMPCMVRYSEAALRDDWPLVWTSLATIDKAHAPPRSSLAWPALHLRSPPVVCF